MFKAMTFFGILMILVGGCGLIAWGDRGEVIFDEESWLTEAKNQDVLIIASMSLIAFGIISLYIGALFTGRAEGIEDGRKSAANEILAAAGCPPDTPPQSDGLKIEAIDGEQIGKEARDVEA